jgi:hypothetical protein
MPVGMVKGEPKQAFSKMLQLNAMILTKLDFKDMTSIIRLDPDDLVLVAQIQRFPRVLLNGYMEHGGSYISDSIQCGVIAIPLRNELRPAETILRLRRGTSRDEYGTVIDRNRHRLLLYLRHPQRGRSV